MLPAQDFLFALRAPVGVRKSDVRQEGIATRACLCVLFVAANIIFFDCVVIVVEADGKMSVL